MKKELGLVGICLVICIVIAYFLASKGDEIPLIDSQTTDVTIAVEYHGEWYGEIISGDKTSSWSGIDSLNKTIARPQGIKIWIISIIAQKRDDNQLPLTLKIIINGKLVKQGSTASSYGVVHLLWFEK